MEAFPKWRKEHWIIPQRYSKECRWTVESHAEGKYTEPQAEASRIACGSNKAQGNALQTSDVQHILHLVIILWPVLQIYKVSAL